MKSPRFDRMSIEVHIPENKFDIAVYLARNTIHQIRLLYSVGLLNKVNVFLACSKIEHYGHFWPLRHQNFPISQLCTQLKFLHKEVKIPT